MSKDRSPRGEGEAAGGGAASVSDSPGRVSRVARRYPVRRRAAAAPGDDAGPGLDDIATAAVSAKGGGRPVEPTVARQVGNHLGQDFTGVRVHDDPMARAASAAMGARAFAYGADVFLGPEEHDTDLGLMAHELTHVAQQGAAGAQRAQAKVTVGAADSPAEHEADRVAAEVTGGGRAAGLLVDTGPPAAGQMLRSTFFAQLQAEAQAAAADEAGLFGRSQARAYVEESLGRIAARPAAAAEASLRAFAPEAAGARDAGQLITAVAAAVRAGIQHWRATGQAPPGMPTGESAAIDGAVAARMGDAVGADVSMARIHTGPEANRLASDHGALAVTVGRDVAFAAGAYQPGTIEGDALLAHELGHVVQQKDATGAAAQGEAGAALEDDADRAAGGALARLWGGAKDVAHRAGAAMTSGLTLARCPNNNRVAPSIDRVPAGPARDAARLLAASDQALERNTATHLADGTLNVYYLEDAVHPPNENAILTGMGLDPAVFMVITHPTNGNTYYLQRNSEGFQPDNDRTIFWGLRSASVARWRTILVHETNHARNPVPTNIVSRYRSEFRAYWVAEFAGVADLDDRARQIRTHILRDYPLIRAEYDSVPATRTTIDGITRPDGNTDNR